MLCIFYEILGIKLRFPRKYYANEGVYNHQESQIESPVGQFRTTVPFKRKCMHKISRVPICVRFPFSEGRAIDGERSIAKFVGKDRLFRVVIILRSEK